MNSERLEVIGILGPISKEQKSTKNSKNTLMIKNDEQPILSDETIEAL